MIAHHNEHGTRQELSQLNLRKRYDQATANAFDFWWKNGMDMKLIDSNYMRLLPKGEQVAAHWQAISERLYAV